MAVGIRNEKVDILRGIAAVLMVLGHSFIVYPINISEVPWCAAVSHFIYTFHMELFFILAGVVYHCVCYKEYLKKKIKRIVIPYFIFGLSAMMLRAFGGAAVNGIEPLNEGIEKLLFRGGGYWFLYVSFMIFMFYPALDKVLNKCFWLEVASCATLLIIDQCVAVTSFLTLNTIIHYLPYFIFGRIIAKISGGGVPQIRLDVLFSFGLIVFIGLDHLEIYTGDKLGAVLHFVRAIAICTAIYCCITLISKSNSNHCVKLLRDLFVDASEYSLQIYLFNGYLLTIIRIILCSILKIRNPLVIVGSIWLCDLAISLVLCKCILPKVPILAQMCGIKVGEVK